MNKEQIQEAINELKKQPKRKFSQSYDLIINLKNIEIKQNPLHFYIGLHYPKGKKVKVAALIDQELAEQAQKYCDLAITEAEFVKYKDKKVLKKLAEDYDYFIAQATLMTKVAAAFGRVLGSKGKMPNPKLGCVVPPNANLEPLVKRLKQTVCLNAVKATNLQCIIGKEDQPDSEIIDNIMTVYQAVLKQLPNESQNLKNVNLKLSMTKPVRL